MKKHLFILVAPSLTLFSSPLPPPTTDYIGQWTSNDSSVFLEITNDSILSYEFYMGCYDAEAMAYTDNGNGSLTISISGQPLPIFYTLSNNYTQLEMVIDTDTMIFSANTFDIAEYTECSTIMLECDLTQGGGFESTLGQFQTEVDCITAYNNSGGNSDPYLGQWQTIDSSLFVEFTSDSILMYDFDSSGCYNLNGFSYVDTGGSSLLVNGFIPSYYNTYGDTLGINIPTIGDYYFLQHSFDISQYEPCGNDSMSDPQFTYLGQWIALDSLATYVHFTADSILIYRFDSTQCYTYNSLVYTDIGNNQLEIALFITSTYSFSNNGNTMSINITGLGDLELHKDTFDASAWTECTWEWQCTQTSCENVGNGNGTFNTQADCLASCDTTISVTEYFLDASIYPNPFEEYAVLTFSSAVTKYQLYDVIGRFVREKIINTQVDYLHKGELRSGFYILRLVGEKEIKDKKLIIK